jgi:hypothetical protein
VHVLFLHNMVIGIRESEFGANQFTLNTKEPKPGLGWNGGLSIRGNFYNNWFMVFNSAK